MVEQKKAINWRKSEARKIIINDLDCDVLSLNNEQCTAEEAWERTYKGMVEFNHVPFSQFKARLADHRQQAKQIDWKKSETRKILIDDLQKGYLAMDEQDRSAEEAWEFYKHFPEFEKVPFKQFKDRLADHRSQAKKDHVSSLRDEIAFVNSRAFYPRAEFTRKGEKVFDLSPAKELLRQDIKTGHVNQMTPEQIRLSRPEYLEFGKTVFHGHVRQAIRREKFDNLKKKR